MIELRAFKGFGLLAKNPACLNKSAMFSVKLILSHRMHILKLGYILFPQTGKEMLTWFEHAAAHSSTWRNLDLS
jgi:hypothetical protein